MLPSIERKSKDETASSLHKSSRFHPSFPTGGGGSAGELRGIRPRRNSLQRNLRRTFSRVHGSLRFSGLGGGNGCAGNGHIVAHRDYLQGVVLQRTHGHHLLQIVLQQFHVEEAGGGAGV